MLLRVHKTSQHLATSYSSTFLCLYTKRATSCAFSTFKPTTTKLLKPSPHHKRNLLDSIVVDGLDLQKGGSETEGKELRVNQIEQNTKIPFLY
jgi:hypothetical protein